MYKRQGYSYNLTAVPLQFTLKSYDYLENKFHEFEAKYENDFGEYGDELKNKSSKEIFPNSNLAPIVQNLNKDELDRLGEQRMNLHTNQMIVIRGNSWEHRLKPGAKVKIQDPGLEEDFGEFVITHVDHQISKRGNYQNTFTAIPATVKSLPISKNQRPPFCETQIAHVTSVKDNNKKMGRVKVKFNWQQGTEEESPWIRVASPYTGGDKGFYMIPEVGDQVMVDFEHHNPDKPYVLGGFYHKDALPANYHDENYFKVIKTRSGNEIFISDEKGKEMIKVSNPASKSHMVLTGGDQPSISIKSDGDISITAADSNIVLSGKNIELKAAEKLNMSGKDIESNAINKQVLSGMDINVDSKKSTTIDSKGQVGIKSTADTSITALMIKLNS